MVIVAFPQRRGDCKVRSGYALGGGQGSSGLEFLEWTSVTQLARGCWEVGVLIQERSRRDKTSTQLYL